MQQAEMEAQNKEADRQVEIDNNIRDNQTKLMLKDDRDNGEQADKLELDMTKHQDKIKLDRDKLDETIRSNKAKETISKKKVSSK